MILMASLPSADTPLNQHSLRALEQWLQALGATRSDQDPCDWVWEQSAWSALLRLDQQDLGVIWTSEQPTRSCSYPYGLTREDVEAALRLGP